MDIEMLVRHKNSQELHDLTEPKYIKNSDSRYGYLVYADKKIFFICDNDLENVTDEYNLKV